MRTHPYLGRLELQSVAGVIVDTSVWVDYIRGRDQGLREAVGTLIYRAQAYLCGVVLAELSSGARTARDRDRIDSAFKGLPYLELSRPTWAHAGSLSAALRAQGITLPLPDLLIATLALEHGYAVFTRDAHSQRVPRLQLYQPSPTRSP